MRTQRDPKKSVQLKRNLLKDKYENLYKDWNGNFNDDRQLFCNVYERLIEALDDMTEVTNLTIWVGFDRIFHEDETMLSEIKEYFTK